MVYTEMSNKVAVKINTFVPVKGKNINGVNKAPIL
jgi:hypothetical protein